MDSQNNIIQLLLKLRVRNLRLEVRTLIKKSSDNAYKSFIDWFNTFIALLNILDKAIWSTKTKKPEFSSYLATKMV